jgi:ABC-type transport system involved in multi-copper enzyme maturation permease subunit
MLDHLLSFRFMVAFLFCVCVVLISISLSATRYIQALTDHGTNVAAHEREVLTGQSHGSWSGLLWRGTKVDKPLNQMTLFARPPHADFLATATVNAYWEPELASEPNLVDRIFGVLDLAYFITAVLSLMAIVFSYDTFCGEKQRGTLRLTIAYPVPRETLVLGKWVGGFITLLLPYLVALLCGLLLLILGFGIHLEATSWACLGLMVGASILYLGAMYSLGTWLSTCFERPVTAMVVLLMIWVIMVILVPSLGPYVAERLAPIKPIGELELEKRAAKRELAEESRIKRSRYPVESFENWVFYAAKMDEMRGDQVVEQARREERINEQYRNKMGEQVSWAKFLSRISPSSSFQFTVSSLAANGPEDALRFWKELVSYRQVLTKYAFYSWGANARENGEQVKQGLKAKSTFEIQDYPRFAYSYPDAATRFSEALTDILLLCLWNGVFFFGAYLTFLRYDVR